MVLVVAEKEGPHGFLLAITDKDILGKNFEEKKVKLDLRSVFYKGRETTKEEIKKVIFTARDLMFTGKEAVALGIELNFINPEKILYVQKIPHALVAIH